MAGTELPDPRDTVPAAAVFFARFLDRDGVLCLRAHRMLQI